MKKYLYVIFILVIGVSLIGYSFLRSGKTQSLPIEHKPSLIGEGVFIPVTIRDSEEEREMGLSNTTSLPQKEGMLFIFDTPGEYGFWMKDMRYPIDIVWLDQNLTIVGITNNVSPESYPEVFYPPQKVQYVLEVNAESAQALGLEVWKTLQLEK